MSIKELSKSKILSDFIEEPKKLSNACATCMFEKLCAGNCKALNSCYFDDKGYCGYQAFLQDHYQDMYKIANNL
jgi:uncharacterized protein